MRKKQVARVPCPFRHVFPPPPMVKNKGCPIDTPAKKGGSSKAASDPGPSADAPPRLPPRPKCAACNHASHRSKNAAANSNPPAPPSPSRKFTNDDILHLKELIPLNKDGSPLNSQCPPTCICKAGLAGNNRAQRRQAAMEYRNQPMCPLVNSTLSALSKLGIQSPIAKELPKKRAKAAGANVAGAKVAGAKVAGAKVAGAKVEGAKVAGAKVVGAKASPTKTPAPPSKSTPAAAGKPPRRPPPQPKPRPEGVKTAKGGPSKVVQGPPPPPPDYPRGAKRSEPSVRRKVTAPARNDGTFRPVRRPVEEPSSYTSHPRRSVPYDMNLFPAPPPPPGRPREMRTLLRAYTPRGEDPVMADIYEMESGQYPMLVDCHECMARVVTFPMPVDNDYTLLVAILRLQEGNIYFSFRFHMNCDVVHCCPGCDTLLATYLRDSNQLVFAN